MYKKLIFLCALFMCANAFAVEKIVTIDPSTKNTHTSSLVITNGTMLITTNSVAKEAVVGTASGPSAADAGKPIKAGPFGTVDPSLLGTTGAPSSNQFLKAVSSTNAVWETLPSSGGFSRADVYNSSAAWTNTFGVTKIMAECWGGGGNGGQSDGGAQSSGGGGGGAGYTRSILTVTNNEIVSFTVGAGTSSTTLGGMTAGAGSTGQAAPNATTGGLGGAGGTATGGDENIPGNSGMHGLGAGVNGFGGIGGSSAKGGGGAAAGARNTNGQNGGQPGGGASGASGSGTNGGTGGTGRVIIWY